MGMIERRDSSSVEVRTRHQCVDFAFGSALGPGSASCYWWATPGSGYLELLGPSGLVDSELYDRVAHAIGVHLAMSGGSMADVAAAMRDRQDELAELPEVP